MRYKLVPTIDTIILGIKSEIDFEITTLESTPVPSSNSFSYAQPSTFLDGFLLQSSYTLNIKWKNFKTTLGTALLKYHYVPATATVATPYINPTQEIQAPPYDATAYSTATFHHDQCAYYQTNRFKNPSSTKITANHTTPHQQRTPLMTFFRFLNAHP